MNSALIVDDDPGVRRFLRKLLEKEQFEVFEASNGNDCMDVFQKASPSVVLIDIVMPEKDGITAIQSIRNKNKETKIVAISGGALFIPETYLDEALLAGADYAFKKPFDRNVLIATIKDAVNP